MLSLSLQVAILVTVSVALIYRSLLPLLIRKNITDASGHPIPPGPLLRYPFLPKYPERILYKWTKQFGPLFSVFMGNQLFVVISDVKIAKDLLVSNGAIFSSRKPYFIKSKTILTGRAITAMGYDAGWRQHRRLAMQLLTPKAVESYASVLDYESHILIRSFLRDSGSGKYAVNPVHHAGRFILNNMLAIAFGSRTISTSDPLVDRALEMGMEFMELTGPWSNAVDFIPILQRLPVKIKARARKLHDDLVQVYGDMINCVQTRMRSGAHVPDSLVKTLLETQEQEKLDLEDMCMLVAAFTLGGVHSASGLIQWFMALLPAHPEVQEKAREELDRVVGRERFPEAEDEPNLPYIRAIIKEVQRIHAPFWMATPHYSTEDFVYHGVFIPKNTAVVLNCYAIHHDEERYSNASVFEPERYLGDDLSSAESANLPNPMERDHYSFGIGRRICPGIHVAERELFLGISRLLWSFSMHEVPGHPISLEEYEGRNGRTPRPFVVRLVPRHGNVGVVAEQKGEFETVL